MAFSNGSFFAGIGTAFAAIAIGFAGGAMLTNSAVQPPNKLERAHSRASSIGRVTVGSNSGATHSDASSSPDTSGNAGSSAKDAPPSTAATAPAPAADQKPAQQAQPAPASTTDTATNVEGQPKSAPADNNGAASSAVKSEDASAAKKERADPNREASRKRADDKKHRYSERRRRQDQDQRRLDEATNTVRQMQRGDPVDAMAERDDAPRFGARPRRLERFGDDEQPRVINEPPQRFFGLFGE